MPEKPPQQEKEAPPPLWKSLLAEVFGTFALTFVAAGAIVVDKTAAEPIGHVAKTVAPGLTVMAMIYALGHCSGAHINPAVTLAFTLRRVFPLVRLPAYWASQLAGAILAAFVVRELLGSKGDLGATLPTFGIGSAFWMEFVLSLLLYMVILGTANQSSLLGPDAGIPVGATVALCGLFAGPVSGASMNPARSLGPAIVSGRLDVVWIYIVAPFAASVIAVLLAQLTYQRRDPKEQDAAQGKG